MPALSACCPSPLSNACQPLVSGLHRAASCLARAFCCARNSQEELPAAHLTLEQLTNQAQDEALAVAVMRHSLESQPDPRFLPAMRGEGATLGAEASRQRDAAKEFAMQLVTPSVEDNLTKRLDAIKLYTERNADKPISNDEAKYPSDIVHELQNLFNWLPDGYYRTETEVSIAKLKTERMTVSSDGIISQELATSCLKEIGRLKACFVVASQLARAEQYMKQLADNNQLFSQRHYP
ncbi:MULTISPECIES: hypothetical protein [unclassified Undibacterium]|uniref:hypothetical protein n=1 Tax=unclassified Undibacterium TaxID=2630295 RepID=UPI002AC8FF25|nr:MULTISPECIES: hypothetical protein [unclassified Undibacterium]MEB0139614.1 hypothetical protein [Undibacterium sp. CCC2.1]MEB0171970.1 hypothetical protein [Undibacterium sp. CCC1.1]MEB0176283.1 hypothetical protein [Undibacterium sp. CCC3.4]MEB0213965.1 hypothetical protein [Undibacterium sp. 5I2]WPX43581.1 hypothetical protein RHM61_19800 [Undibacterium sp. CCC3.4]